MKGGRKYNGGRNYKRKVEEIIMISNLVKHSGMIQMRNCLSTVERKIFNYLINNARQTMLNKHTMPVDNLPQFLNFTINMRDLENWLGSSPSNRSFLCDLLSGFVSHVVQYNIFDKDKNGKELWSVTSVLVSEMAFSADHTVCRYSFPNGIAEAILNPTMYAKIDLNAQLSMSSKHSGALYEYYEDILGGKRETTTTRISLEDYRKLLNVGTEYQEYKDFKRYVLKKSHAEINELSPLKVEIEEYKIGRKVVALDLTITRRITNHAQRLEILREILR